MTCRNAVRSCSEDLPKQEIPNIRYPTGEDMAEGILGILACPMFADNLIYSLAGDPEDKKIYVLDAEECATFRRKLDDQGIPYEVYGHRQFYRYGLPEGSGYRIVIDMLSLGLHSVPEKLKEQVEERVMDLQPFVDGIGLYYAWCGNYNWDMQKWAESKGLKPLRVFRDSTGKVCDDCVSVAVDGTRRYLEMQKQFTGMLYVFPAMADNAQEFLMANSQDEVGKLDPEVKEYLGITDGDSYFRWLLSIGNYRNLLRLDTGIGDTEVFDRQIADLERRTELPIIVAPEGWATKGPTERMYAECKAMLLQRCGNASTGPVNS